MDSNKPHMMLAVGWVAGLGSFILHNINAFLSAGAVVAAIAASIYSALASRAKKKFYEKEAALLDKGSVKNPSA